MIIFKRWYKLLRKYVGRFRSGHKVLLVRAYMEEGAGVKSAALGVGRQSQSEECGRSARDINKLDQQPENHSINDAFPVPSVDETVTLRSNQDIDSTGFDSLEDYAAGLRVTEETIAKWVNAGILSPRETEVAEKLLKIMREKRRQDQLTDSNS